MTRPVRDVLIDYLLGALDEPEQELIEERLRRSGRLRRILAQLRETLAPLDETREPILPPPGLAERTSQYVFSQIELLAVDGSAEKPGDDEAIGNDVAAAEVAGGSSATTPSHAAGGPHFAPQPGSKARRVNKIPTAVPSSIAPNSGGIRLFDMVTVAGILVALGALLVPALHQSRLHSRLLQCQDNLRQVGLALSSYSQHHNDYFPAVPTKGNLAIAGIYAPMLLDCGYLNEARRVICPADSSAATQAEHLPTLAQLQQTEGTRLHSLQRRAGGSYGYSLGHVRDGIYRGTENQSRPYFALMADAPSSNLPDRQSANHGGDGQNVLFEDGRVDFVPVPVVVNRNDHVFFNDAGQIAAGTHADDAVLASGAVAPLHAQ